MKKEEIFFPVEEEINFVMNKDMQIRNHALQVMF
jgi:hypothetical protein